MSASINTTAPTAANSTIGELRLPDKLIASINKDVTKGTELLNALGTATREAVLSIAKGLFTGAALAVGGLVHAPGRVTKACVKLSNQTTELCGKLKKGISDHFQRERGAQTGKLVEKLAQSQKKLSDSLHRDLKGKVGNLVDLDKLSEQAKSLQSSNFISNNDFNKLRKEIRSALDALNQNKPNLVRASNALTKLGRDKEATERRLGELAKKINELKA